MEDADLFRSRRRDASRCPTRTRVVAVPETPNQRLPSKAHAPRSRRPPPQRGTAGETPWRDREWRNERSRPSWVKKPTAGESRKSSATCQLPPVNVSTFCLLKPPACPCNRAPLRTRTLVFLIQWLGRSLEKRPSVCVEPAPLAAVVTVARSPRGRARPDTLARSRRSRVGFS